MKTKYLLGETWDKIDINTQHAIADGHLQGLLNYCDRCLVIDYTDDLYWNMNKEYSALCTECWEEEGK